MNCFSPVTPKRRKRQCRDANIVAAVQRGVSYREAAATFGVSLASVARIVHRHQERSKTSSTEIKTKRKVV